MRKILTLFIVGIAMIILSIAVTSCKVVGTYDDVNHYKDATILKIEHDTIENTYKFYVKDRNGSYRDFYVDPNYGDIFEKGDVI